MACTRYVGGSKKHKTTWVLGRSCAASQFPTATITLLRHCSIGLLLLPWEVDPPQLLHHFYTWVGVAGLGWNRKERRSATKLPPPGNATQVCLPTRHCLYRSLKVKTNPIFWLYKKQSWIQPWELASLESWKWTRKCQQISKLKEIAYFRNGLHTAQEWMFGHHMHLRRLEGALCVIFEVSCT